MKKNYREITVNDIPYGWTINNDCDGDGSNLLKIWFDKKVIYEEIVEGCIIITPKFVSDIILSLNNLKK